MPKAIFPYKSAILDLSWRAKKPLFPPTKSALDNEQIYVEKFHELQNSNIPHGNPDKCVVNFFTCKMLKHASRNCFGHRSNYQTSMFVILTLMKIRSSLRIESSAIINLRGVSTKLNKYIMFLLIPVSS